MEIQDSSPAEVSRVWAERIESDERLRFSVLRAVYEIAAGGPTVVVNASHFPTLLSIPAERIFAVVEFLSREGYLAYRGAGPRVALTERGVEYVEAAARRRGTLRD